jgi:hypothetical protein
MYTKQLGFETNLFVAPGEEEEPAEERLEAKAEEPVPFQIPRL